jgi:predicted Rossmann fold nucleotide-binding protein DprA/Smf involved in DNA uptake
MQYTEEAYANLMRRMAIREGHKTTPPAPDHDYTAAIREGCKTTAEIAEYVETNARAALSRLVKLESLGLIKRKQDRVTHWSLK